MIAFKESAISVETKTLKGFSLGATHANQAVFTDGKIPCTRSSAQSILSSLGIKGSGGKRHIDSTNLTVELEVEVLMYDNMIVCMQIVVDGKYPLFDNVIAMLEYVDKSFVTFDGIWWIDDSQKPKALTDVDSSDAQIFQQSVLQFLLTV